jgi:hypothetical protein
MQGNSRSDQSHGFRPIEEAPIRAGEMWGPVLVFPSETGWYAFGVWDGAAFFNKESGALLEPKGFQELPVSPASISFNT